MHFNSIYRPRHWDFDYYKRRLLASFQPLHITRFRDDVYDPPTVSTMRLAFD